MRVSCVITLISVMLSIIFLVTDISLVVVFSGVTSVWLVFMGTDNLSVVTMVVADVVVAEGLNPLSAFYLL